MNRRNAPSESQFTGFIVHRYSDSASDVKMFTDSKIWETSRDG